MSSGDAGSWLGSRLLTFPAALPKAPFRWALALNVEPLVVVRSHTPRGPMPPASIFVFVPDPRTRICAQRKLVHWSADTPLLVAVVWSKVNTTVGVGEIPPDPFGA